MAKLRFGLRRTAWPVAALAVALLAGCTGAQNSGMVPPDAATVQGQDIRDLYNIVFLVAAVIFLIVEALIIFAVIRYRRRPGDTELPAQTHGNNLLEIIWTIIPTVIVAALFIVSFQTLNTVQAKEPDPAVKIDVIGYQWQWQFVYTDHVVQGTDKPITINGLPDKPAEMVVPIDQTVHLTLRVARRHPRVLRPGVPLQARRRPGNAPGSQRLRLQAQSSSAPTAASAPQFCGLHHWQMTLHRPCRHPRRIRRLDRGEVGSATRDTGAAPAGQPGSRRTDRTASRSRSDRGREHRRTTGHARRPGERADHSSTSTNKDAGIPHDVSIHKDSPTGEAVFTGEIVRRDVATKVYDVPALPAGTYAFVCTVHPTMVGTLTVK